MYELRALAHPPRVRDRLKARRSDHSHLTHLAGGHRIRKGWKAVWIAMTVYMVQGPWHEPRGATGP